MRKMYIGIDLSINSTGLVIIIKEDDEIIKETFYNIIPEENLTSGKKNINVITKTYKKEYNKENYSSEDLSKIIAASRLAAKLKEIIDIQYKLYEPKLVEVRLEGSVMAHSFKSNQARLNDLTCFNTMNKFMLITSIKYINSIYVLPPTVLKKLATGKGNSKKEVMIEFFMKLKPNFDTHGKIDDIVDAYYLASSEPNKKLAMNLRDVIN